MVYNLTGLKQQVVRLGVTSNFLLQCIGRANNYWSILRKIVSNGQRMKQKAGPAEPCNRV